MRLAYTAPDFLQHQSSATGAVDVIAGLSRTVATAIRCYFATWFGQPNKAIPSRCV